MKSNSSHLTATRLCLASAMAVVLTLAAHAGAQDNEPLQKSEGAKALLALKAELKEASRKHVAGLRKAKSDEERDALERNSPYRLFEPRFLALARKFKNDDAAFSALNWLVETANPGPVFDQGLAELQECYLEQEGMAEICRTLVNRRSPGIEPFLRHVATITQSRMSRH